jgi:FtsP/CotA-like multicopper oxidase with cupredoxin domain
VQVETQNVTRACNTTSIAIVNNMLPGPTLYANEGDTVVIKVTSKVASPVTIHWYGDSKSNFVIIFVKQWEIEKVVAMDIDHLK